MTGGSITAVVVGAVVAACGFVGTLMSSVPTEYRDGDGYYMDDPFTVDQPSRAVTASDIEILEGAYAPLADDAFVLFVTDDPVDFRMQGTSAGTDALFLGVAPAPVVSDYLQDVAHDEIVGFVRHDESKEILDVRYTTHEGTGLPGAPGSETFWAASVEGTGMQELDWTLESGDWTAVIMNADASSGVTAEAAFGAAPASSVDSIGGTATTVSLIMLAGGALLMIYGLVRR